MGWSSLIGVFKFFFYTPVRKQVQLGLEYIHDIDPIHGKCIYISVKDI